jgi:tRNA(Arg) A34 adenosine deaminase TadA
MYDESDITYLKLAIANSRKSLKEGRFPAGGIVVNNGKILASEVSVPYPGLFHADSKAITTAFNKIGSLKGATLYVGLESCLMCIGVAYWSGLRRIIYAIPKSKVSGDYYETHTETKSLIDTFNEQIERIHIPKLEEEAMAVVREWERKYLPK